MRISNNNKMLQRAHTRACNTQHNMDRTLTNLYAKLFRFCLINKWHSSSSTSSSSKYLPHILFVCCFQCLHYLALAIIGVIHHQYQIYTYGLNAVAHIIFYIYMTLCSCLVHVKSYLKLNYRFRFINI